LKLFFYQAAMKTRLFLLTQNIKNSLSAAKCEKFKKKNIKKEKH